MPAINLFALCGGIQEYFRNTVRRGEMLLNRHTTICTFLNSDYTTPRGAIDDILHALYDQDDPLKSSMASLEISDRKSVV